MDVVDVIMDAMDAYKKEISNVICINQEIHFFNQTKAVQLETLNFKFKK